MPEPTAQLQELRASTAGLVHAVTAARWSDDDLAEASLCRGWTRGHVLTHLARNADGIAATLQGALDGAVVARYPGGRAGRDADIEAGSRRAAAEVVADLDESAQRLDRVIGAVREVDGWALPTAEDRVARDWVFARMKEVEIHRVDLAAGYLPDSWPVSLVTALLPAVTAQLAQRSASALRITITADGSTDPGLAGVIWPEDGDATDVAGPDWAVLAWLIGRPQVAAHALTAAPELDAWG